MKRQILYSLFVIAMLFSCEPNKKEDSEKEFEVLDTQMAEVKGYDGPDIEILRKDTTEFLKFWKDFYKYYEEDDTAKLIKLSFDSVVSPVYNQEYKYFKEENSYLSIADFLHYRFRKKDGLIFIPYSKKNNELYHLYIRYEYNKDSQDLKLKKDSVFLSYTIVLLSKEVKDRHELLRTHSFSFIKAKGKIKFSGLEMHENNSRFRNDSITRSKLYFPLYSKTHDAVNRSDVLDTFSNLWYSNSLASFNEPYLYNYKGDKEIYRFTWLRSFHNPIVIRFEKHGKKYTITTKEMWDGDGYVPDSITRHTIKRLSSCQWYKWISKIDKLNFWEKETHDPNPLNDTDGAMWVLEANVNGKYHFVTRQSPLDEYRECCKYLLFLSRLKIPKEDIY